MAGKLPKRTIKGGATTPRKGTASKPFTGKGSSGTGMGYHGNPGNAKGPAKGLGYHGKPPKGLVPPKRRMKGPGMVHPIAKPAAHRAGTRRAPGHNISTSKSK